MVVILLWNNLYMNILSFLRDTILTNDRSKEWPNIRKKHLEKQPFCQACGSIKGLEVHHIEPFHINASRELDPDNLITLCNKNCHFIFGHLMDYSSWNVNVVEDCEIYLNKIKSRPYKIKISSNNNTILSYLYRGLSCLIH